MSEEFAKHGILPTIKNPRLIPRYFVGTVHEEIAGDKPVCTGQCYNDPLNRFPDGSMIRTSPVHQVLPSSNSGWIIITENSVYWSETEPEQVTREDMGEA